METATLDTKIVKLELFGPKLYRLLGEEAVVDEDGNITFSYSENITGFKIQKRKRLKILNTHGLENLKSYKDIYLYRLEFPENKLNEILKLICSSEDPLFYIDKSKERRLPKNSICNNAIELGSGIFVNLFLESKV